LSNLARKTCNDELKAEDAQLFNLLIGAGVWMHHHVGLGIGCFWWGGGLAEVAIATTALPFPDVVIAGLSARRRK
jgi:hypothetical protein